MYSIKLHQML